MNSSYMESRTERYRNVVELIESEEPIRFIIKRLLIWGYTDAQIREMLERRLDIPTSEIRRVMELYKLHD